MSQPEGVMVYQDKMEDLLHGDTPNVNDHVNNHALDIKISNKAFTAITCIPVQDNILLGD